MFSKRGILLFFWLVGLAVPLFGCSRVPDLNVAIADPVFATTAMNTATETQTPFQALTNTPIIDLPTFTPTSTHTPSPTDTPLPTDTPIPTPTSNLIWHPSGDAIAPILLYHHVADIDYQNRYYVSVSDFRAQMEALRSWGYTSITVTDLVNVLIKGGEFPNRPVVITFDDGNLDVYQNAFPILHEMGFVATTYIVANRLQASNFVDVEQLQEMADDGWEIGCHSMSHADLTIDHSMANYEMAQSRSNLEEATGEPVNTFAYPYGKTDEFITDRVSKYGYSAGMGLGSGFEHTLGSLFYLSRIEVQGDYGLNQFAALLPWSK
jgi:peptidoglycan/xylan/chitin deacetylase (PgdA/CDA1 family)